MRGDFLQSVQIEQRMNQSICLLVLRQIDEHRIDEFVSNLPLQHCLT